MQPRLTQMPSPDRLKRCAVPVPASPRHSPAGAAAPVQGFACLWPPPSPYVQDPADLLLAVRLRVDDEQAVQQVDGDAVGGAVAGAPAPHTRGQRGQQGQQLGRGKGVA